MKLFLKSAAFVLVFIEALLLVNFLSFPAFAAGETVIFEMPDADYKPNRVFTVSVYAQADATLSAGVFELSYDSELIEFRKARAAENTSEVEVNQTDGYIKLAYLSYEGKDISAGEAIFALTFKTLENEGTGKIELSASECTDINAEFLSIGDCTGSNITVSSSSSGTVSTVSITSSSTGLGVTKVSGGTSNKITKSSSSSVSNGKSSSSSGKSEESDSSAVDIEATEYENSSLTVNPVDDGKLGSFLAGVGITLGVGGILIVMFIIGKRYGQAQVQKFGGSVNDRSVPHESENKNK